MLHSIDRLARNLDDLRTLVRNLTSKGIDIQFCKEQLTFTNNDSPMFQLLLSVMGAFAEFERALLKERANAGEVRSTLAKSTVSAARLSITT
ncbi:recombinase family protein [Vibrio campbellii]